MSSDSLTETKELRLALVLYGGVSLAIYMHGSTKEIHRLAKASLAAVGDGVEEHELTPSERVYRDLLLAKAERAKRESGPRLLSTSSPGPRRAESTAGIWRRHWPTTCPRTRFAICGSDEETSHGSCVDPSFCRGK